jgi:GH24 family phage-related lysozyme (muramidase)
VVDQRLLNDLAAAEGVRLTAYKDSLGKWTIGVGHLLDQAYDWTGDTIDMPTAMAYLTQDTQARIAQAQTLPEWNRLDTDCRQNAVVECIYNLGLGHWTNDFPGTRRAIAAQDWQGAHDKLLASPLWIAQVGLGRVTRLANYLLTGEYPQ